MPYWLVEGELSVYLLLAMVGVILAVLWQQTRQRKYAIGVGAVAGLALGYFLLDRFVESEREQMYRKVHNFAQGAQRRDWNRTFAEVSESFSRKGRNKKRFREFAEQVSQARNVTEFIAWDFVPGETSRTSRTAKIEFKFKIRGNWANEQYFIARTTWTLDGDDQWRLSDFDVFNPFADSQSALQIPGW